MFAETNNGDKGARASLKHLMAEYERTLIVQALAGVSGHQRRAAALLGILPTTLHEKMKRLGIPTRASGLRHALPQQAQGEQIHVAA